MCPRCTALEWDAIEASGRGTVYSFVMPRHPPCPFFEDGYIVALVELEEGVADRDQPGATSTPDDASIGMPVEVRFEDFDDGVVAAAMFRCLGMSPTDDALDAARCGSATRSRRW